MDPTSDILPITSPAPVARAPREHTDGAELVAAWQASGLSMRAFASQHGTTVRRIAYWRQRVPGSATRDAESAGDPFVEVRLSPSGSATIDVACANGAVVRVGRDFDAALLRSVVAALVRSC